MSEPIVIEGVAELDYEDSGMAAILNVGSDSGYTDIFARIQSYRGDEGTVDLDKTWEQELEETKALHTELNEMRGKRVRVTVEVLDE